jgi:hypothetical protein
MVSISSHVLVLFSLFPDPCLYLIIPLNSGIVKVAFESFLFDKLPMLPHKFSSKPPLPFGVSLIPWVQALRATYGSPFTGHSHQFCSPLGSWFPDCNKGRWFYSNAQQSLFQRSDIGFVRFATSLARSSRHQSRRRFYRSSTVQAVPPDAVPTIVHSVPHSDTVVLTGIRPTPPGPPNKVQDLPPSPRTLAGRMAGSRQTRHWATRQISLRDDGVDVATTIMSGTAKTVSDGSYLPSTGNGAAGYVLICSTRK